MGWDWCKCTCPSWLVTGVNRTCGSLDYVDDHVRSRFLSVLIFVGATGALMQAFYEITQSDLSDYPALYFLAYGGLAFGAYLVAIPLQWGNTIATVHQQKNFTKKITFSMVALLVLAAALCTSYTVIDPDNITAYDVIFICTTSVSILAILGCFGIYLYMLIQLRKNPNETNFREYKDDILARAYQKSMVMRSQRDVMGGDKEPLKEEEYGEEIDFKRSDYEWYEGSMYALKQYLWPKPRMDSGSVVYPSRLFMCLWLTIVLLVVLLFGNYEIYNYVADRVHSLNDDIDTMEDQEYDTNEAENANQALINIAKSWRDFLIALKNGIIAGAIIGFLFGLYSLFITFKAFRKKLVNMRNKEPTFRYDPVNYPYYYSGWFMASTLSYICTGSLFMTWILAIVFGLLAWPDLWEFIGDWWQYIVGYCIYYVLDYILFRWLLLAKYIGAVDSVAPSKLNAFRFVLVLSDITYIPLSTLTGFYRMLYINIFFILSFVRPDVNMFPRGFESWDMCHKSFVATVRLLTDREEEAYGPRQESLTEDADRLVEEVDAVQPTSVPQSDVTYET